MICAHQQEYDEAINAGNNAGKSTAFIEFMLSTIKASFTDALNMRDKLSDGTMDKTAMRWKQIKDLLQTHAYIMNADVRTLCSVSSASANQILHVDSKRGICRTRPFLSLCNCSFHFN